MVLLAAPAESHGEPFREEATAVVSTVPVSVLVVPVVVSVAATCAVLSDHVCHTVAAVVIHEVMALAVAGVPALASVVKNPPNSPPEVAAVIPGIYQTSTLFSRWPPEASAWTTVSGSASHLCDSTVVFRVVLWPVPVVVVLVVT